MKARLKILLLTLFIFIHMHLIYAILYPIYWVLTGKNSILLCIETIERILDKMEINKL